MELKGGRAVEQLVSLSLHIVSGSLHRVSLQGPVVALGELDYLHGNWRLQGKVLQQARWKLCAFSDLPKEIMQHYFHLILLVTGESQILQDWRRRDIENSQDHLVNERVRWKVLLQPFLESAVCYSQASGANNSYSSYMENTLAFSPQNLSDISLKPVWSAKSGKLWMKLFRSVFSGIVPQVLIWKPVN